MRKIVLLLMVCFGLLFSKVLTPEEAFNLKTSNDTSSVYLHVELGKDIYLYADEFKVYGDNGALLNQNLQLPNSVKYGDEMVFKESFDVQIPLIGRDFDIKVDFQGCSTMGLCYQPMSESFSFDKLGNIKTLGEHDLIARSLQNGSLWLILVTFFGFGLLLSLTPCIFPMIPILSSIIVAQGGKKISAKRGLWLSFLYVFAMSVAYTVAGVVAALFGANLQASLQNPLVIGSFSALFVILSLSMFGLYSLELPKSFQSAISKLSKNSEGHGALSVIIMGLLSALIVGPCVAAPLAGALIYIGQSGDIIVGGLALFVMSFGMGVPLLFVGASAGKVLPKPGLWMNVIKNIFGLCMLGTAIWLLGRVIPSHVELLLWGVLALFSALLFWIPSEGKVAKKFLQTLLILLMLYGSSLVIGSFAKATDLTNPFEPFIGGVAKKEKFDFEYVKNIAELEKSVRSGVVMVDFYASWCVSCNELESVTFVDPRVKALLERIKLVKVDVADNTNDDKELLKKYALFGPPALIFYKDGKEIVQMVGFKSADEFLKILEKVEI